MRHAARCFCTWSKGWGGKVDCAAMHVARFTKRLFRVPGVPGVPGASPASGVSKRVDDYSRVYVWDGLGSLESRRNLCLVILNSSTTVNRAAYTHTHSHSSLPPGPCLQHGESCVVSSSTRGGVACTARTPSFTFHQRQGLPWPFLALQMCSARLRTSAHLSCQVPYG